MDHAGRVARIARFARVSTALALLSDAQLSQRIDDAQTLGTGIGGSTLSVAIDGQPVFVKRLRLSDLERRPEHRMSTRNLFALPSFCHRNVGSVGFGAWRELAANAMSTGWVLSGQLECFPLMFHWRVLDGVADAAALPDELADIEAMVAYWEGAPVMRVRLQALIDARASLVIFLEHLPWNLGAWLAEQWAAGPAALAGACAMVEQRLMTDIPAMNALGLLHGDAHHGNLLTDGHRLYVADLGLALSDRFELSAEEAGYLRDNASLDRAYVRAKWVNWLVKAGSAVDSSVQQRFDRVRAVAQGQPVDQVLPGLPDCAAAIVRRHARVAALVNDFYVRLHGESRSVGYPREALEALLADGGT